MSSMREEPRHVRFELVDEATNARRVYAIRVDPSLFYQHALTIVRGRMGSPLVTRVEEFVTRAQMTSRWRELVARRRAHGYSEVES